MLIFLFKEIVADSLQVFYDLLLHFCSLVGLDNFVPLFFQHLWYCQACVVHVVSLDVLQHNVAQQGQKLGEIDVHHVHIINLLNVPIEE